MKRAVVGAYLPTLRLFEPAERPDGRADYCLIVVGSPKTEKKRHEYHVSWSNRLLLPTATTAPVQLKIDIP